MTYFFFRTDPVRQFISGHVANSMAAEVIELLHSLMNAPVSNTARSWAEAVQRVRVTFLFLPQNACGKC